MKDLNVTIERCGERCELDAIEPNDKEAKRKCLDSWVSGPVFIRPQSSDLPPLLSFHHPFNYCAVVDHSDASKPSHRLANGTKPSKTIESDGSKTNNHWKTIDGNGQTAKKHSMVMVASKTIENLQWSLQNHWNVRWFPGNHWTCQWSPQINEIHSVL